MLCAGDASDIGSQDIPDVLTRFDRWYERQSPSAFGLEERVNPLIAAGQLDSALRRAWVFFKTRVVEMFDLPAGLDGSPLFNALFSDRGKLVDVLTNSEREAYLNLFRGLYVLNRNEIGHNEIEMDPEQFEAVLAIINSALVRLEKANRDANAPEVKSS